MEAGAVIRLHCSSEAGNPPASLTWRYDEAMLATSVSEVQHIGQQVSSKAVFILNEGNEVEIACEVMNEALEEPLREAIVLPVVPFGVASAVEDAKEEDKGEEETHNAGSAGEEEEEAEVAAVEMVRPCILVVVRWDRCSAQS